jgi:hypothetical protein
MILLTQFLLRLSFGMAAGMLFLSSRQVSSGYFRNHLYVVLGLASLAALLSRAACAAALPWAIAAAALSYVGAVCWLYEKPRAGKCLLALVAGAALIGAWLAVEATAPAAASPGVNAADAGAVSPDASVASVLRLAQTVVSGLLLGVAMAAMLLGHWYLTSPGMKLAPLKRLIDVLAVAIFLTALVCGTGLALEASRHALSTQDWLFLALRWSFGIVGVALLAWMARRTLDIPNTQSATGILYVAVIGVFVGETMSLLLSAESVFPI